ncbi:exopolyphosphatase [Spongiibacter sp. KMU-158]|uniref:Exopolyphosphatase n=1 Tax=Spongiibacter pelagi TaxID=2760804 RepID=A0A927C3E9_9GAMM|nr:exopolyphosphatase [Spongiibacter pelagi]MBD2859282.1 exopolyphosphatase [Spongiibacter pelagi]
MSQNTESYAALDLGSNSFHLLIASFKDNKLKIIDRHKDMVRLAAGLDENDFLSEDAQQRALDSLAKIANRLTDVPRKQIRVVGTNTLRAAENAGEFMRKAEAVLGVPINIISGTEEARLVYLGVANDLAPDNRTRLVVDIGGGSTELVTGDHHPKLLESLPMGCVSFSMRFFPNGSINEKQFNKAVSAARQLVSPYVEQFQDQWQEAVGSSGTIRSIANILSEQGLCDVGHITPDGLKAIKSQILQASHTSELKIQGLSDDRRDVFPGGFAVLYALFKEMNIPDMHVSTYAVREGILYDLAGRFFHRDKREETVRQLISQYRIDENQGNRVAELCTRWLPGIAEHLSTPVEEAENLLRWAAQLHELGLAIAHGGYHKHGAYILTNADLPGFSRQEQARLSLLVLNHRRKPKSPDNGTYGVSPDWLLVGLLRLACIFLRRRQTSLPSEEININSSGANQIEISLPQSWLDENPLTAADLEEEAALAQKSVGLQLEISARD